MKFGKKIVHPPAIVFYFFSFFLFISFFQDNQTIWRLRVKNRTETLQKKWNRKTGSCRENSVNRIDAPKVKIKIKLLIQTLSFLRVKLGKKKSIFYGESSWPCPTDFQRKKNGSKKKGHNFFSCDVKKKKFQKNNKKKKKKHFHRTPVKNSVSLFFFFGFFFIKNWERGAQPTPSIKKNFQKKKIISSSAGEGRRRSRARGGKGKKKKKLGKKNSVTHTHTHTNKTLGRITCAEVTSGWNVFRLFFFLNFIFRPVFFHFVSSVSRLRKSKKKRKKSENLMKKNIIMSSHEL